MHTKCILLYFSKLHCIVRIKNITLNTFMLLQSQSYMYKMKVRNFPFMCLMEFGSTIKMVAKTIQFVDVLMDKL